MSVFNEYGNLQDEQTKNVRELVDFIVAVDLAGSDVIIYQQHKMGAREFRNKLTAAL